MDILIYFATGLGIIALVLGVVVLGQIVFSEIKDKKNKKPEEKKNRFVIGVKLDMSSDDLELEIQRLEWLEKKKEYFEKKNRKTV